MDKEEMISYWVETSEKDFNTMLHLYKSKDFHWSLFLGHLVIEKLLKAVYVERVALHSPRIHDLLRLAEKSELQLSEEQKDLLDILTTFNINARYPDYKRSFYKKSTEKYTGEYIEKVKEMRIWILKELGKI